jgi:hypothetical protein
MNPAPAKPAFNFKLVILALAAFFLLASYSTELTDSDSYWHLATGKFLTAHRAMPVPDPFSFTTYLAPPRPGEETVRNFNLTHEWLYQIFMYAAYAAGGYGGVILLRAALMTACVFLTGLWVWRRTHGFYRSLAAAAVTAFIATYFNSDRPYQITYVVIVAVILILEYRRNLWLLPPIFLLWANCHGGFIMGFAVLGAYGAEALWLRLQRKPLGDERRFWIVTALCFVAAFLNPNGFQALWVLAAYRGSAMQASLYEWRKPELFSLNFLNLLLFIALGLMVWNRRRARVSEWLLLVLFGAAYLSGVRNSPLLAIVAPAIIAIYLPWKRILPNWVDYAAAALALAALALTFTTGRAFQLRSAEWKYPGGASDFLLAHHIAGPMFNAYEKGGYLIWRLWPSEKSFIDGRALSEAVYADYQQLANYSPSSRFLLDKYAIQVIVMNSFEANSGTPYVLPLALADPNEKEWKMIFTDAGATIFMHHPPEGVTILAPPMIFTGMEAQCQSILDHDAARPGCAHSLGRLFARLGDNAKARRWTALYIERSATHNPADEEFLHRLSGSAP